MIAPPANTQIWIAAGVTDMRRGFTGLSALVQTALEQAPLLFQLPLDDRHVVLGDIPERFHRTLRGFLRSVDTRDVIYRTVDIGANKRVTLADTGEVAFMMERRTPLGKWITSVAVKGRCTRKCLSHSKPGRPRPTAPIR
jgi:hypothetical protein